MSQITVGEPGTTFCFEKCYPEWEVEGLVLLVDEADIRIAAGQVHDVAARLQADPSRLAHRSNDVTFRVQALDHPHIAASERARFLGPEGTLR